jgi:hypothetical protein
MGSTGSATIQPVKSGVYRYMSYFISEKMKNVLFLGRYSLFILAPDLLFEDGEVYHSCGGE